MNLLNLSQQNKIKFSTFDNYSISKSSNVENNIFLDQSHNEENYEYENRSNNQLQLHHYINQSIQEGHLNFNNLSYNNDSIKQLKNPHITQKALILMKRLQDLIKQLCLTKNSVIQVEQELGKLLLYFIDTINNQNESNNKRSISVLSQIRVRNTYELLQKSSQKNLDYQFFNSKIFNRFFQCIYPDASISYLNKSFIRLNNYQIQIFQQFIEKYLNLLQKQINRIARYKGQKKLKYLLETVLKDIFSSIMRFTYETKIQIYRKQQKNPINKLQNKIKILSSLLNKIFYKNNNLKQQFKAIKYFSVKQGKNDGKLINKLQIKFNSLNYILRINQRKQVRETFFKWRKQTYLIQKIQKENVFTGINQMVQDILRSFAENQAHLQKWKLIIWSKMNSFIKSLCIKGQCVLFPIKNNQFDSIQATDSQSMMGIDSRLTSNMHSRIHQSLQFSQSYRHLTTSQKKQNDEFQHQKQILQQIYLNFTNQQFKACLKSGQILMNNQNENNFLLIPIKVLSGIIGVKYFSKQQNQNQKISNARINVNNFYNILQALQIVSPILLEIIHLQEKFDYFHSKIKENVHHKLILSSLVELKSNNILGVYNKHTNKQNNKMKSTYSQIQSLSQSKNFQQMRNQRFLQIESCLKYLGVQKIYLYHLKQNNQTKNKQIHYNSCLGYNNVQNYNNFYSDSLIGKQIIEAIFSEFGRSKQTTNFIPIKTNNRIFYTFPFYDDEQENKFIGILLIDFLNVQQKLNNKQKYIIENQSYIIPNKHTKIEQFREQLPMIKDVLIPMILEEKLKNKYTSKNQQTCYHCLQIIKNQNISLYNNIISQNNRKDKNQNIQCLQNKINYQQTTAFIQKVLYQIKQQNFVSKIQQLTYNFIRQKFHQNQQTRNTKSYQFQENVSIFQNNILESEIFMKILYPIYSHTKDNKIFFSSKQQELKINKIDIKNSCQYQYLSLLNYSKVINNQNNYASVKLNFIDKLAFFNSNKKINQQQSQQLQKLDLNLSKIIEIYKNYKLQKQNKKNIQDLDKFIYQILLSLIHKVMIQNKFKQNQPINRAKIIQEVEHSLDLLLYQIQHSNNKQKQNKIIFRIQFYPIFSYLNGKSRYLTGINCIGKFISIPKNKQQNERKKIGNQIKNYNELILQFNGTILSKLIQVQKLRSLQQKKNCINLIKNQQKNQEKKVINAKNKEQKIIQNTQCNYKINLYKKTISHNQSQKNKLTKIYIKGFIELQNLIKMSNQMKIKRFVIQKFKLNVNEKVLKNLLKIQEIMSNKNDNNLLQIKQNYRIKMKLTYYQQFFEKLIQISSIKTKKYVQNSFKFQRKMNNVFIRNKIYKFVFNKLKKIELQENYQLDQGNNRLIVCKKISIQRIQKTLNKLIYHSTQNRSKNQKQQNLIHSAFNYLKQNSIFISKLQLLKKHQSITLLSKSLQNLICKKSYLYFFIQLQKLQKSLNQNLSLIGSQIQFMKFYSISSFLKFINQRISIIINSQKNLIKIIYGLQIENVIFYFKIKAKQENNDNKKFKLFLIQEENSNKEKINVIKIENDKINIKNGKQICISLALESQLNYQISLCFSFQIYSQQNGYKQKQLSRLSQMISKVSQNKIIPSFNHFFLLYQRKIDAFCMKLNKIFKLNQNNSNHKNEQNIYLSKAFKRLQNQLIRKDKIYQNQCLIKQIQSKKAEYQQLRVVYQTKSKIISSNYNSRNQSFEILSVQIDRSLFNSSISEQVLRTNSNSFFDSHPNSINFDINEIITKGMIKQMKQNLENLQNNCQNLSIQYQIKSKTTSSYQIIDYLNKKQNKQALQQVTKQLMNKENSLNLGNKQMINHEYLIAEKQQLNKIISQKEQKNYIFNKKYKKLSIRMMAKIVNNRNKNILQEAFYKINNANTYSNRSRPNSSIKLSRQAQKIR